MFLAGIPPESVRTVAKALDRYQLVRNTVNMVNYLSIRTGAPGPGISK
jgi:hypothetical protein